MTVRPKLSKAGAQPTAPHRRKAGRTKTLGLGYVGECLLLADLSFVARVALSDISLVTRYPWVARRLLQAVSRFLSAVISKNRDCFSRLAGSCRLLESWIFTSNKSDLRLYLSLFPLQMLERSDAGPHASPSPQTIVAHQHWVTELRRFKAESASRSGGRPPDLRAASADSQFHRVAIRRPSTGVRAWRRSGESRICDCQRPGRGANALSATSRHADQPPRTEIVASKCRDYMGTSSSLAIVRCSWSSGTVVPRAEGECGPL